MVKILIDKYSLEDSMVDNTVGVFKTKEFQNLYNDLVSKGSKSLLDAIKVGLTIEDLDIYDLDKYLAETKNPDVREIFERLKQGSFHHAQAFKRQLDRNGGSYEAQFVSKERWEEVLKAPHKHNDMMKKANLEIDKDEEHEREYENHVEYEKKEIGFFERI